MTREELYGAVMASREYGAISEDAVLRIINAAMPKYKSEKLVLKSIKSTLREISGAFAGDAALRRAEELTAGWNVQDSNTTHITQITSDIRTILTLHQSTRERLDFAEELWCEIRRVTGFTSVLDVGCGLNPFFLPLMPCYSGTAYYATDINTRCIALVNKLFSTLSVQGEAYAMDALTNVPEKQADCAFLFKTLPLLERLEKGGARRVAGALNCGFLAITFPTRSLSGKNVGMKKTYDAFLRHTFFDYNIQYTKEYPNELLYIISK